MLATAPTDSPTGGALPAPPRRRDIVSRESGDRSRMLRFVVDPERRLVPDLAARLPGRGIWVIADRESLAQAVKKRLFDRQAGGPVVVPEDLGGLVERLLVLRACDTLGLGRRAGEVVQGFDQVAAVLAGKDQGVLVEASDAAVHGARKLRARQGDGPLVACLTRAEIGRALGRDAVVHAWMRQGTLATRLLEEATRLEGFRHRQQAGPSAAGPADADDQQGTSRAR
ncbi:MAG TPA: RNA-binding protein [Geminicoccaceae bacterium]|jgi:predicted RNA-binding protein YlxR (DUF448 family)|nr:RNA-binding protein [Geminicoccaceae bacterium]HRY24059.1 RNA-binding protein [Geminicoccaceae bacterium]